MIWTQMRGSVADNNQSFRITEVMELKDTKINLTFSEDVSTAIKS